mmetsp:Transcript_27997/g.71970  ORF Transcript_27997/g.71970 Transcript_27997/m.71970 type:complete len:366 (+) Transcript_27997:544-1641(+)
MVACSKLQRCQVLQRPLRIGTAPRLRSHCLYRPFAQAHGLLHQAQRAQQGHQGLSCVLRGRVDGQCPLIALDGSIAIATAFQVPRPQHHKRRLSVTPRTVAGVQIVNNACSSACTLCSGCSSQEVSMSMLPFGSPVLFSKLPCSLRCQQVVACGHALMLCLHGHRVGGCGSSGGQGAWAGAQCLDGHMQLLVGSRSLALHQQQRAVLSGRPVLRHLRPSSPSCSSAYKRLVQLAGMFDVTARNGQLRHTPLGLVRDVCCRRRPCQASKRRQPTADSPTQEQAAQPRLCLCCRHQLSMAPPMFGSVLSCPLIFGRRIPGGRTLMAFLDAAEVLAVLLMRGKVRGPCGLRRFLQRLLLGGSGLRALH